MTTYQVPQTHARQLVRSYALCDRLNIPKEDSHRAALWLDRHGITEPVIDEVLSKHVEVDLENPLIKLFSLTRPAVLMLRDKHEHKQVALLGSMVRDRAKEESQPDLID